MQKKEVFISKKTAFILMNAALILSFVFFFLMIGNTTFAQKYSFVQNISNYARTSETKTFNVTVSAESKEEYQELQTFNGANLNNRDVYNNSVLAAPNEKNSLELVSGGNKIVPTTIILRTLFSYKQNDEENVFKLESDDLYIERTEIDAPAGTKTISVTKSVAEKIASFSGEANPSSALGKVLNFNFFDYSSERISVPVFVRSIIVEDGGIMPTYKINYGDDLIFLAANAYDYNIVDSRLDIRYSQSIYRNFLHTDALVEQFGSKRLSFDKNNFLSVSQIENINIGYRDTFLQSEVLVNPLFVIFLVFFLLSFSLATLCLVIYFKKYIIKGRRHNFVSIFPFVLSIFIFYAIATIMYVITKGNVAAGSYLMAPRSITFITFLVIGLIITFLSPKNKGNEVNE